MNCAAPVMKFEKLDPPTDVSADSPNNLAFRDNDYRERFLCFVLHPGKKLLGA